SDKIITAHSIAESKKYSASILLVEDNIVNQKMTKLMLSKAGYSIDVADNGKVALEKYTTDPEGYDLIFMDINMPVMDGLEATRRIRAYEVEQEIKRKVPILALTANVLDNFKKRCLESGMDDFLVKPIKREIVFQSLKQWIDNF
ncbi:MAG: response regulator, partial [Desulfobacteraceae bacterium]|nr:response regulator [Desulfobacteraceae bacterium]